MSSAATLAVLRKVASYDACSVSSTLVTPPEQRVAVIGGLALVTAAAAAKAYAAKKGITMHSMPVVHNEITYYRTRRR
jgi:hypothetical protein